MSVTPTCFADEDPLYIPPRPRIGGDDIVPAGFRPPGMGSGAKLDLGLLACVSLPTLSGARQCSMWPLPVEVP